MSKREKWKTTASSNNHSTDRLYICAGKPVCSEKMLESLKKVKNQNAEVPLHHRQ